MDFGLDIKKRSQLRTIWNKFAGKDLIKELKSELGGHFEDAILALFKTPTEFDAWCLHDAMSGAGTTESTLIEIMCSRSNDEIKAIKVKYIIRVVPLDDIRHHCIYGGSIWLLTQKTLKVPWNCLARQS